MSHEPLPGRMKSASDVRPPSGRTRRTLAGRSPDLDGVNARTQADAACDARFTSRENDPRASYRFVPEVSVARYAVGVMPVRCANARENAGT